MHLFRSNLGIRITGERMFITWWQGLSPHKRRSLIYMFVFKGRLLTAANNATAQQQGSE